MKRDLRPKQDAPFQHLYIFSDKETKDKMCLIEVNLKIIKKNR